MTILVSQLNIKESRIGEGDHLLFCFKHNSQGGVEGDYFDSSTNTSIRLYGYVNIYHNKYVEKKIIILNGMKHSLLSIISFAFCLTVSGQQISQSTNHNRGGDVLEKKQVIVKGFSLNGSNGVWSIENADISKKTYQTEYTTENDTIMMLERGNRTYYNIENGLVSIIGLENAQEIISYDMPETWLKFPMYKGDSISGYFNGTGKYCDHLFMRRYGTYLTKTDAVGKLVLPSGDTLRNVVRLHTERHVGTIATPIDTIKRQIPAFTVDSIINHLANDTAKIHEDIYRWYAEGYRYPVLEAKVVSSRNEKLSEEMFYCPPEMQELLIFDEENKRTRARIEEERVNGYTEDGAHKAPYSPISRSDVDVNGHTAVVTFDLNREASVRGIISTISGMLLRQQSQHFEAGKNWRMEINCQGLRKGEYVIFLNVNNQVISHVFTLQ